MGATLANTVSSVRSEIFAKILPTCFPPKLAVEADNQTIVFSGGTGYRFSDSVTVRDARSADVLTVADPELPRQSGKMRSTNIASELGCSLKTFKRELDTLRLAGHIEFVGTIKTGIYQLLGRELLRTNTQFQYELGQS